MAFTKLNLAPDQASYAVTDGAEVVATALDGGAARYRRDVANANARVNVQWRVNPLEFRYLKTFFNLITDKGTKTFLLDLYLDREELTEHECHFVPGSFRLSGQRGKQFTVVAQLEATPIKLTDAEEAEQTNWVTLFGEFGENYESLFPPVELSFDHLVNYEILNFGVPTLATWQIAPSGLPIFADGNGWNNGFGVSVNGHTQPDSDPGYSFPTGATIGDYTWDEDLRIPIWFDGVGWINGMGAAIDGHTIPAPNLSYTRPVAQSGDMIYDEKVQIPLWYDGTNWYNIMQGVE